MRSFLSVLLSFLKLNPTPDVPLAVEAIVLASDISLNLSCEMDDISLKFSCETSDISDSLSRLEELEAQLPASVVSSGRFVSSRRILQGL